MTILGATTRLAAVTCLLLMGAGDAVAQGQGKGQGQGGGQGAGRGAGMQERIEMIDADGDGLVQEAELAEWRETVFLAMDGDGDGALTRDEYMAVQLGRGADPDARGPRYAQMQEAKAAEFEVMDADGDGLVPLDVFTAHADAQFSKADTNGDGALNATEFRTMHGRP